MCSPAALARVLRGTAPGRVSFSVQLMTATASISSQPTFAVWTVTPTTGRSVENGMLRIPGHAVVSGPLKTTIGGPLATHTST